MLSNQLKKYYCNQRAGDDLRLLAMEILSQTMPPTEFAAFLLKNPLAKNSSYYFLGEWQNNFQPELLAQLPPQTLAALTEQLLTALRNKSSDYTAYSFFNKILEAKTQLELPVFEKIATKLKLDKTFYYSYSHDPAAPAKFLAEVNNQNLPRFLPYLWEHDLLAIDKITPQTYCDFMHLCQRETIPNSELIFTYLQQPEQRALRAEIEQKLLSEEATETSVLSFCLAYQLLMTGPAAK